MIGPALCLSQSQRANQISSWRMGPVDNSVLKVSYSLPSQLNPAHPAPHLHLLLPQRCWLVWSQSDRVKTIQTRAFQNGPERNQTSQRASSCLRLRVPSLWSAAKTVLLAAATRGPPPPQWEAGLKSVTLLILFWYILNAIIIKI